MTFISYPTISGEMTGFSVFIGVWEMMPKPKNWLRRKLCWILFARQSDPKFSVVLLYWYTYIYIFIFSDNLLWIVTRLVVSSMFLFVLMGCCGKLTSFDFCNLLFISDFGKWWEDKNWLEKSPAMLKLLICTSVWSQVSMFMTYLFHISVYFCTLLLSDIC